MILNNHQNTHSRIAPENYSILTLENNTISKKISNIFKSRAFKIFIVTTSITLSAMFTVALFINPIGLSIVSTTVVVGAIALVCLGFIAFTRYLEKNKAVQQEMIQNSMSSEVRNLFIDSLHTKIKNDLVGDDAIDDFKDEIERDPTKNLEEMLNDHIISNQILITEKKQKESIKKHFDQIIKDIKRVTSLKIGNESIIYYEIATGISLANRAEIEQKIKRSEPLLKYYGLDDSEFMEADEIGLISIINILEAIEKTFPEATFEQKGTLIGLLHQGIFTDIEKQLINQRFASERLGKIEIRVDSNMVVTSEMDVLFKDTDTCALLAQKGPLVVDERYREELDALQVKNRNISEIVFLSSIGAGKLIVKADIKKDTQSSQYEILQQNPYYQGNRHLSFL